MPTKKRSLSAKPPHVVAPSVLGEFHCDGVSYHFEFLPDVFNAKKFFRETGIKLGEKWSAVICSEDKRNGYHVHFEGRVTSKKAAMTVGFWSGTSKPDPNESGPFAESMMLWLGQFVNDTSSRAFVWANFGKPADRWRARFNLPFKVTMAGAEVTIDGVSLILPRNPFRAFRGRLSTTDTEITASVQSWHSVEFGQFDIRKEVAYFNDAIKILVEQVA